MKTQRKILLLASLFATLVVAGCWDNDDDDAAEAPSPPGSAALPDSAGVSGAAFLTYLLGLSPSDETSEPLTIGDTFAVPADETSEPTPLT